MSTEPNSQAKPSTVEGNWDLWDDVWQKATASGHTITFTQGSPRTLAQQRQRCYFEDIWNLMPPCDGPARCLELGAGKATTSTYLATQGCRISLVDLAEQGLAIAKQNFADYNLPEPELVLADARDTGLPADSYDCVYNVGLLEHFIDPLPVLAESMRLLRPGGLLYSIIIPPQRLSHATPVRLPLNPLGWGRDAARLVAHKLRGGPKQPHNRGAIRTDYTQRQWLNWMAELGQTDAHCVPYVSYHKIYRHESLNSRVALPLYRLHHGLKRKLGSKVSLKTWPWLSTSQLLYCWKQA